MNNKDLTFQCNYKMTLEVNNLTFTVCDYCVGPK